MTESLMYKNIASFFKTLFQEFVHTKGEAGSIVEIKKGKKELKRYPITWAHAQPQKNKLSNNIYEKCASVEKLKAFCFVKWDV